MAIHEQDYVRYDGPIQEGRAWSVIAWRTFRLYLSFLRTKLVLLLLGVGPSIFAFLINIEFGFQSAGLTEGAPGGSGVSLFLQTQVFSVAILLLASGCAVVSEDLRYNTFQLYFSKPIRRIDYAAGKFLGIFMLSSLISVIPAFALALNRAGLYSQTEFYKEVIAQMAMGVGLSALFAFIICSVVAGLSSLTRSQGTVVLTFLGVLIVPQIFSLIVAIATGGADSVVNWFTGTAEPAHLFSLNGNMLVLSEWLISNEPIEKYAWVSPIVLTAVTAAGLGTMWWRISKLEGVA